MAPINWTEIHFINGLFALITILVSIIIGILIAIKYRKYKLKIFLYWGFAWCGFYIPWWGSATSFVHALITQETIAIELYLFLGAFFIPPFIVAWIYGLTEMILKDKRKILVIFYLAISIIYDIVLIGSLLLSPELLYESIDGFDISFKIIHLGYLLFMNFTLVVSGILFARNSRKSIKKEPRMKGLFIIAACILFFIAAITDGSSIASSNVFVLIFARLLLIFSSILFYIGMFMPKIIKKLLKITIKLKELEKSPEHIENVRDFLKILQSEPKSFTEEEITSYREQDICLVCKGEAIGRAFLHECEALYCRKCLNALIELENRCWACENALDKAKPVKKIEEMEDLFSENIINESDNKNHKKKTMEK